MQLSLYQYFKCPNIWLPSKSQPKQFNLACFMEQVWQDIGVI